MGDSNGDGSGVVGAPGVLLGAEARREGSWLTPVLCMALVEFTVNSLGQ